MSDAGRPSGRTPIGDWLLGEGRRIRDPGEMLVALCERLVRLGMPLDRASLHVGTLHPQVRGIRFLWWRGRGLLDEFRYGHDAAIDEAYRRSPLFAVQETGKSLRRRLERPDVALDFPILAELKTEGITDYFVAPLFFSRGPIQHSTWGSRCLGGFGETDLATIEGLLAALGAVMEAHAVRHMTRALLETYLGPQAGARVLNGTIRRGDGQTIAAALWFCDLRGFTMMSNALPRDELIELLNGYFDCMAGPVHTHGGEILKFIGDGILAIFPIAGDLDRDRACHTALAAAENALADLGHLNSRRRAAEKAPLKVGIALHTGAVMYGNIGTHNRLDFTVIGPAVNLVTRIERLCAPLDRPLLASARFASPCGSKLISLGQHPLKGIAEPQEIYGLPH